MGNLRPPSGKAKGPPEIHPLNVAALMREAPMVRRLLVRHGMRGADVDDATQDVIIAAWFGVERGRYSPDPSAEATRALHGWLAGITWNVASQRRKRLHARHEVTTSPENMPGLVGPDLGEQIAARDALRVALDGAKLTAGEHAVLVAWAEDRGSVPAYARAVGMSASTAYKRLARALEKMRRAGGR